MFPEHNSRTIKTVTNEPTRIEKILAARGIASRREAKELLKKGSVRLGSKRLQPGEKVPNDADLTVIGIDTKDSPKETYAVYKPRGVVSSKEGDGNKTIFTIFPRLKHLNTVGRLDKESEGLILLSNDGLITKAVTDKSHPSEKEYIVTVREDVLPWMMAKFEKGVRIEGYKTMPAKAEKIDRHTFRIILNEGKKHQIRRMANAVGLTINSLKRIRINDITIGKLRPGNAAKLTSQQVAGLKELVIEER